MIKELYNLKTVRTKILYVLIVKFKPYPKPKKSKPFSLGTMSKSTFKVSIHLIIKANQKISTFLLTCAYNDCRYTLTGYFKSSTAWKVSKHGVFSGPYFTAFGLNTERYFFLRLLHILFFQTIHSTYIYLEFFYFAYYLFAASEMLLQSTATIYIWYITPYLSVFNPNAGK